MHDTDTGTDKGNLVMLDVTPETTWKELFVHDNNTRDNKRQGKSITSLASTVKSTFVKYGVSSPHDAQHMHASQLCECIRYHHPDGETLHSGVMEALRLLGRHEVCKDLEGIFPTKRRWKKCVDPAATDGIRDDTNYNNKSSECDDNNETVQPCCDTNIGVVECDNDDDVTQYVLKQFVVGKHTLRFDVTRSADQEDALRIHPAMAVTMDAEEFHGIMLDSSRMDKEIQQDVHEHYATKGGVVYILGVYATRVEAEFARQRCIDRLYFAGDTRNVGTVYGRHTPENLTYIDPYDLPDCIDVWDPEGDITVNVRIPRLDHIRMAVESCLVNNNTKNQCRHSTLRHRAAVTIRKLQDILPTVLSDNNTNNLTRGVSQDRVDDMWAEKFLWETLDTLVRSVHATCRMEETHGGAESPYMTLCAKLARHEKKEKVLRSELNTVTDKLQRAKEKLKTIKVERITEKQDHMQCIKALTSLAVSLGGGR